MNSILRDFDKKNEMPCEEKDLYDREVKNLLSEGGTARLISQYKNISRRLDEISCENRELKKRISELESLNIQREQERTSLFLDLKQTIAEKNEKIAELACENKEAKADLDKPSAEWYENRHQQDCIEINRLNTTIDVLIHKIEYLRQFAGLE